MSAEWRTLPAGRDMDALFAERVMGWRECVVKPDALHGTLEVFGKHPEYTPEMTYRTRAPHYSEDVAAAMSIGPALRTRPDGHRFVLRVVEYPYGRTYASFAMTAPEGDAWSEANSHEAGGQSPTPLAIVRAALAATEAA